MNREQNFTNVAPSTNTHNTGCGRENARAVLSHTIKRKEEELDALTVLDRAIPWDVLSREDESKLWGFFCRLRS